MTARSPHDDILSIMALAPVIPVLTVRDAEDGVAQAKALVAGGLRAIEVTLRTPAALAALAAIASRVAGAVVGAALPISSLRARAFSSARAPRRGSPRPPPWRPRPSCPPSPPPRRR
jgi:2-dehydro-3-deoxyphosphogluconate aldolase/(4S)-4-hydroxy-2-oxoglutarate aldolase